MAATGPGTGAAVDRDVLLQLVAIEEAAAALHDAVVATGLLDPAAAETVATFAAHHRAHATAYLAEAGDDPTAPEADAGTVERLAPAVIAAVDGPTMLAAVLAIEQAMRATAIDAVARLGGSERAVLAARVAAVEALHATTVATATGQAAEIATPEVTTTEASLLDG